MTLSSFCVDFFTLELSNLPTPPRIGMLPTPNIFLAPPLYVCLYTGFKRALKHSLHLNRILFSSLGMLFPEESLMEEQEIDILPQ